MRKKRTQPPYLGTDEGGQLTSESHPNGCEILFEGTSPIIAEKIPFQYLISVPDLLINCSIVFVHGLRGHRTETWTKDHVCWPKDLLSKEDALSHTRVLTFGYDANIVNASSSLFRHSINLLDDLSLERRQDLVSLMRNPSSEFHSDPFSRIGLSSLLRILLVDW
jgi:hypothetical protein